MCLVMSAADFSHKGWSVSDGMYSRMDSTGQFRIRQRSLIVLVEISLLCLKLQFFLTEI